MQTGMKRAAGLEDGKTFDQLKLLEDPIRSETPPASHGGVARCGRAPTWPATTGLCGLLPRVGVTNLSGGQPLLMTSPQDLPHAPRP
jgi:hypothetical protein